MPATSPRRPGQPQIATTAAQKPGQQPPATQAKRPPPFKIAKVQHKQKHLKLLAYGAPGAGKTTLAASAAAVPSMRDILLINVEGGDLSIPEELDIDTIPLNNFASLSAIYQYLQRHCKQRDADETEKLRENQSWLTGVPTDEIQDEDIRRYRTVIVDSMTEVEAYCLNQIIGATDQGGIADDADPLEWQDYGKNLTMMLRVTRQFRDLPMHVIFIAGHKLAEIEKKRKYSIALSGQLATKIQGFMDMVGYLIAGRTDDGAYTSRLFVTPTNRNTYDAKHRYHKFQGQYFQDPSMQSILKEVGLLEG